MISRRLGHALTLAALALAGCTGSDEFAPGALNVRWMVFLDGTRTACAAAGVVNVMITTTDSGGGQTTNTYACDLGVADIGDLKASNYTVELAAIDANGMYLKTLPPQNQLVRSGLSNPVSVAFEFTSPATTGSIAVLWTTNGLPANGVGNCPANSTVTVDVDGGTPQMIQCWVGGGLFTKIDPGPRTINAVLADSSGTLATQTATTSVTATLQSMVMMDLVFP